MKEKKHVQNVIKRAYELLNAGFIATCEYESTVNSLCDTHGTEFVAEAFIELTKNGEL